MKKLDLSAQKERMLEMVVAFDAFCTEHGLRYYLGAGTLIGAIRHNGFIPWDDDIDIYMMRDDYNKLIEYEAINDSFDIVTYRSTKYYHPYCHTNIIDKKTIRYSKSTDVETNQGIFVDIFPLDNLPANSHKRARFGKIANRINSLKIIGISDLSNKKSISNTIKKIIKRCLSAKKIMKLTKYLDDYSQKYDSVETGYVGIPWLTQTFIEKKYYNDIILHNFEGYFLSIPKGYHNILTSHYGDYMTPPQEKDRIVKHPADIYWRE